MQRFVVMKVQPTMPPAEVGAHGAPLRDIGDGLGYNIVELATGAVVEHHLNELDANTRADLLNQQ